MNEKGLQVLEQYDLTILRSFGGRGSMMLETEQGLKMLKEFAGSVNRLSLEQELLKRLEQEKVCQTDRVVQNKEGGYVSLGEYETTWILKNWPLGKECDTKNEEHLLQSMRILGKIHQTLRGIPEEHKEMAEKIRGMDRRAELEKHNRELKRVQNFMRAKRKKCGFELLYLKCAEEIMNQGRQVQEELDTSEYEALLTKARSEEHFCHGEYVHHNILIQRQDTAVVNFQRFEVNVQVNDICLFLRKIMEKQNWNGVLAGRMLEAYEQERALTGEELKYLAVCLSYPEKAWKLIHQYYHSNKAWIPEKHTEKLEVFLSQEERRKKMIKNLFF